MNGNEKYVATNNDVHTEAMEVDDSDELTCQKTNTETLLSVMSVLGMGTRLPKPHEMSKFCEALKQRTITHVSKLRPKPEPLFKPRERLSPEEWSRLEELNGQLYTDSQQRAAMMMKRLEVTIDSFLWSDRVKKLEPKLRPIHESFKSVLPLPQRVPPEQIIAANTDLLQHLGEKTSSANLRQGTRSSITQYMVKQRVLDRGGRTGEMLAPTKETFQQQQQQREGGGGRGGGRGGGGQGYQDGRGRGGGQQGQYGGGQGGYSGGGQGYGGGGRGGYQGGGGGYNNSNYQGQKRGRYNH